MPCFEVNTRTVDILYHIAESSEARCRDTTLLIEDIKQKTSEYEAEGEGKSELHYKGLLHRLVSHLSSKAPECIHNISAKLPFPPHHTGAHLRDVLLQGVGLSHTSLSKPTSDYLSALVDTAMVLGIRDTSLSRYLLVSLLCSIFCVTFVLLIASMMNICCPASCQQSTAIQMNTWKQRSPAGDLRGTSGPSGSDSVLLWC